MLSFFNILFVGTRRLLVEIYIINKLKLKKDQTIYIGDTESDIIAASKNGLKPIIFLNGYGNKEDISKSKVTNTINKMLDLTLIVNRING